jgi:hypothetical protein
MPRVGQVALGRENVANTDAHRAPSSERRVRKICVPTGVHRLDDALVERITLLGIQPGGSNRKHTTAIVTGAAIL